MTLCEKDTAFAAREMFPFFALDGMGDLVLAYLVSKSLLILFAISKNKFNFEYVLLKKPLQLENALMFSDHEAPEFEDTESLVFSVWFSYFPLVLCTQT